MCSPMRSIRPVNVQCHRYVAINAFKVRRAQVCDFDEVSRVCVDAFAYKVSERVKQEVPDSNLIDLLVQLEDRSAEKSRIELKAQLHKLHERKSRARVRPTIEKTKQPSRTCNLEICI